MSPLRRALVVLGLLLLLASLVLLVIANLPSERLQDRQPLPAEDLTLPTPQALKELELFAASDVQQAGGPLVSAAVWEDA